MSWACCDPSSIPDLIGRVEIVKHFMGRQNDLDEECLLRRAIMAVCQSLTSQAVLRWATKNRRRAAGPRLL